MVHEREEKSQTRNTILAKEERPASCERNTISSKKKTPKNGKSKARKGGLYKAGGGEREKKQQLSRRNAEEGTNISVQTETAGLTSMGKKSSGKTEQRGNKDSRRTEGGNRTIRFPSYHLVVERGTSPGGRV